MLNNSIFDTSGLRLPTDITAQPLSDIDMLSMEWEIIGEESYINISELQLKFDGALLSNHQHCALFHCFLPVPISGLAINPLPPILDCSAQLNNLEFLSVSPTSRQPNSPSKIAGQFYLASSYLDFGDCKLPFFKTILTTYHFGG